MKTVITTIAVTAGIVFGLNGVYETANELRHYEDDPDWSCVDDGNRVCGPNNDEGKPAACYDDGGVIEMYWPCHRTADGHAAEGEK